MDKKVIIGYDAKRAFHNGSGLGNYSRDLIRLVAQSQKEWSIKLFNPKKKSGFSVIKSSNIEEIVPQSSFWKKLKGIWRTFKITSIAQKESVSLYHGLSGEIPIGIHKHIPTIVTIHDLIFMRLPHLYSFFDRKIHYLKFKYAAKNAHHIIAISEQTKRDIIQYLNVPEEKISVVYQGCNEAFKKEYPYEIIQSVKDKYQLPHQFILNVGTIEERKNALSIVKAIKDIDTILVLIGRKTAYYKKIKEYAKTHKIEHKIRVLSNVNTEELAIIYQLATIFCYPSIFEGFGIPIIEALFSKTPVITSKGSCFPEAGGTNSLYIDLQNADTELKNYIQMLLSNPEKRLEMAEKGYLYAQKFTDEAVTQQLLEVYNSKL